MGTPPPCKQNYRQTRLQALPFYTTFEAGINSSCFPLDKKSSDTEEKDDDAWAADGIIRCENCGVYGMTSEFCNGGRFCSKPCVAILPVNTTSEYLCPTRMSHLASACATLQRNLIHFNEIVV